MGQPTAEAVGVIKGEQILSNSFSEPLMDKEKVT